MITDKIRDLLVRAFVTRSDDAYSMRYLQCGIFTGELQDDVEHFEAYGLTSRPLEGAEVLLVHLDGDRSHAIAAVTTDRRYRPKGLKAGEVCLFDNLGRKVFLSAGGIRVEGVSSPVTVSTSSHVTVVASSIKLDAPKVTVTGDLIVKGKEVVDGEITGKGINLSSHKHTNVRTGDGTSGGPVN